MTIFRIFFKRSFDFSREEVEVDLKIIFNNKIKVGSFLLSNLHFNDSTMSRLQIGQIGPTRSLPKTAIASATVCSFLTLLRDRHFSNWSTDWVQNRLTKTGLIKRRKRTRLVRSKAAIFVRIVRTSRDEGQMDLGGGGAGFGDVKGLGDVATAGVPAIAEDEENDEEDDGEGADDNSNCKA